MAHHHHIDPYTIRAHPYNRGALLGTKASAILTSCAGGAISGINMGIIGGISDPLVKDRFFPDASKSDQSLYSGVLTACILLGAFIGCFFGVWSGNKFGRRISFRITGAIAVVATILLCIVPSFWLIILMRTFQGIALGFGTALCPWYVTEAVPAAIRGSIGTIFQINICGWILVAEIINYAFHPDASDTNLHEDQWRWKLQFGLGAFPGIVMFFLSYVMHESPVFLDACDAKLGVENGVSNGNVNSSTYDETTSLSALVSEFPTQQAAYHGGENSITSSHLSPSSSSSTVASTTNHASTTTTTKPSQGLLYSRSNLKWLAVGLILSASQQLTGINAVIFYAPKIFTEAGMSNPLVLTFAVVGTWNFLTVLASFLIVDRFKRRTLMLSSLFIMFLGAGLMSLAYLVWNEHKAAPAILAMILFIGAFENGPGPLFFLLAVETFPEDIRDSALSFTQSSCWVFSILVTFGFPVLNDSIGPAATFGLFAGLCLVSMGLLFVYVPEPKGTAGSTEEDEEEEIVAAGSDGEVLIKEHAPGSDEAIYESHVNGNGNGHHHMNGNGHHHTSSSGGGDAAYHQL